ncbi:MAG TPA: cyclic nucleotide-binding domain-containing protein [Polyangiaceae bacterium]|jgi:CRP-like cAMP-binding protein
MADLRRTRISREMSLAALAVVPGAEGWMIDRMTSLLEEQEVRSGDVIFSAGDLPDHIYFMRQGRIRLTREGAPPWTFEGRWVIGVFDVTLDRPRTRTATALDDLHLMKVQADAWLELLEDSFQLARGALFNQARTLASLEDQLGAGADISGPGAPVTMWIPKRPLDLVERMATLTEMPLLQGAGVQTLADLAAVTTEVVFEPGQRLLERGVPRDRLLLVLEGEAEASRSAPEIVRRFGPGSLVCGAAAIGEPGLAWEVTAGVRTRVLSLLITDWLDLMEDHFDLLRAALATLTTERERLLDQLAAKTGELTLR